MEMRILCHKFVLLSGCWYGRLSLQSSPFLFLSYCEEPTRSAIITNKVCFSTSYYILDIYGEKVIKYRTLDYQSSTVLPHIDIEKGNSYRKGMLYLIIVIKFKLLFVVFHSPNLFHSSLNTKRKPEGIFSRSIHPDSFKSNNISIYCHSYRKNNCSDST